MYLSLYVSMCMSLYRDQNDKFTIRINQPDKNACIVEYGIVLYSNRNSQANRMRII